MTRGESLIRVFGAALLFAAFVPRTTLADTAAVPFGLQVELFTKVADYDKTLPGRSEGLLRVVIVTRSSVPESVTAAARVLNALSNVSQIAGLPHEDSSIEFTDAASLAAICRTRVVGILYMTPGLVDVDEALGSALVGIPVLTVSSTVEGARKGMVLGFDLVGGRPKLFINLPATRSQGVRLSSDVLKIATVIE